MSPRLRAVGSTVAAVASLGLLAYVIARHTVMADVDPGDISRRRVVIDAETGQLITDFKIKDGTTIPWVNPSTGKASLYPAEACMWTKDGKAKMEPTYVLLNEAVGKKGPTICPDCGRPVVPHNPLPPADLLRQAYDASRKK